MRTSPVVVALAAVASVAAIGLVSPNASALARVVTIHGMDGKSSDQNAVHASFSYWNSTYYTVKAKYYGHNQADPGSASMSDGGAHNINFHGPSGLCNNGGGNYAGDAAKECPWGAKFSGCLGHGGTTDGQPYFAYDHNMDTDIRHIGMHMAWFFSDHWGTTYESGIVAHSMGGLIARSMFRRAGQTNHPSSASIAMIKNTITFGTPHQGVATLPFGPTQVTEVWTEHDFIKDLRDNGGWSGELSRVGSSLNDTSNWQNGRDLAMDFAVSEVKASSSLMTTHKWEVYDHAYMYGYGTTYTNSTWSWGSNLPAYLHSGYFSCPDTVSQSITNRYTGCHGATGDYYHQNNNSGYTWTRDTAPQSVRLAFRAINSGSTY